MVSGPDTASTLPTAPLSPGGSAATSPGGPALDHVPSTARPSAPATIHATVENMTGTEEGERRPPYLHVGPPPLATPTRTGPLIVGDSACLREG